MCYFIIIIIIILIKPTDTDKNTDFVFRFNRESEIGKRFDLVRQGVKTGNDQNNSYLQCKQTARRAMRETKHAQLMGHTTDHDKTHFYDIQLRILRVM